MESWYVDDDAFALCSNRLMTAPTTTFHINYDTTAIRQRGVFRKLLLQIEIAGIGGLNLVKQGRKAIVLHLAHHVSGKLSGGQVHINIEQATELGDTMRRVLLLDIQVIKHAMGIDKAKTLTITIAQASLCQQIVETGNNEIYGIGIIESECAHAVQVLLNLLNAKRALRQANLTDLMQPTQQGIGLRVDTILINPQQLSVITSACLLVSFSLLMISSHQLVEVLLNQLWVNNKCRRLHIRKRLHSNLSVLMCGICTTSDEQ